MRKFKIENEHYDYRSLIQTVFRNRVLMFFDIMFVFASFLLTSIMVRQIFNAVDLYIENLLGVAISAGVFFTCIYSLGLYTIMWAFSDTRDYLRIFLACMAAGAVTVVINAFFFDGLSAKLTMAAVFMATVLIVSLRMSIRALHSLYTVSLKDGENAKRIMIVGAGVTGSMLLKSIINNNTVLNYDIVCFVDDNPNKLNERLSGVKVLGNRNDIKRLCKLLNIDEIIIAITSISPSDKTALIELCNKTHCKLKTFSTLDLVAYDNNIYKKIRDVEIEDLLAREPVILENGEISKYIEHNTVIVTGGGGSIGSELCRQIMRYNPAKLVILDVYENSAYDLQMELNRKYPENKPDVIIASVRDRRRLEDVFKKYKPYIVFHAAAHKHVPLMENSPGEAIKNNVFGTYNITRCADKYGTKKFILISSDKAVNPTNVMGATKRLCEMVVQAAQKDSKTEFVCVRFGNVLGSNGSVIPLFKKQIEQGGPVTVTDKRITRFFMTISEATQLVLQAASYARGGEIFVLDMGEPVKIYDLAVKMIELSGLRPNIDIKIEECGLRPGEKLYEELLMNEEGLKSTKHNKIFIGKPLDIDKERLKKKLTILRRASFLDDNEKIKDVLAQIVPTYKRKVVDDR